MGRTDALVDGRWSLFPKKKKEEEKGQQEEAVKGNKVKGLSFMEGRLSLPCYDVLLCSRYVGSIVIV